MAVSIAICTLSLLAAIWLLRRDRLSLGLPIAYLGMLLLNHVPGAYAHLVDGGRLGTDQFTSVGIAYTAVGVAAFVLGVGLARAGPSRQPVVQFADRHSFNVFFLICGWVMAFGLAGLQRIPSLGAAVEKGAGIWMLAVLLALRYAMSTGRWRSILLWSGAMMVYPVVMALSQGFLSYGTAAVFIVISVLAVSARTSWRVLLGLVLAVYLGLSLFVNYFDNRDPMRAAVWGGAGLVERVDANLGMFRHFKTLDQNNLSHLVALDQRLNQNAFIGLADLRLKAGQADYLHGHSIEDAVLSLVPRAIWPDKPVYGGSPEIVSRMTGMRFNAKTSIGVGQVMEFQVNFGVPGIILGMMGLGWLIGLLDLKAAVAEARGDLGMTIIFFLPGAALIQPIGSLVELSGGAAAALVAALGWRWLWRQREAGVERAKTRVSRSAASSRLARQPRR